MVNTPHQGVARSIEKVAVHSAPKISVSHPVKGEAGQKFSLFRKRALHNILTKYHWYGKGQQQNSDLVSIQPPDRLEVEG